MSDKNFKVKNGLVVTDSIGVGTDTPATSLDLSAKTDGLTLPTGNTSQRPTGLNGTFRFNTTLGEYEGYNSFKGGWNVIAGANSSVDAATLGSQQPSYYLDANNTTGTFPAGHFNANSHGALGGGNLHVTANSTVNGFFASTDKVLLDAVPAGNTIFTYNGEIGNAVNLNTLTTTGWYQQSDDAEAAAGTNYPEAYAGVLQVHASGGNVTQIYYILTNSQAVWTRRFVASAWTTWRRTYDSVNLTDAIILSKISNVDGANSGLDADLLDGQDGSYYTNIPARQGFTSANKAGDTFTGLVVTPASNTTNAGLRVPHGAAPNTAVNGDIWTTTTGLFAWINGALKTVMMTAGGVFTGKVTTLASAVGSAGFNVPSGVPPTTPITGDLWITNTSFQYQLLGATRTAVDVESVQTVTGVKTFTSPIINTPSIVGGSFSGGTDIAVADGGTNISSYTTGDLLYASANTVLSKLAIGSTGQAMIVGSGLPSWGSVIQSSASANTATGATTYDVTGIPSWARRVTVILNGTGFNGGELGVRVGSNAGGILATGYSGGVAYIAASTNTGTLSNGAQFRFFTNGPVDGSLVFNRLGTSNVWVLSLLISTTSGSAVSFVSGGKIDLGANALDRIRLTSLSGTNTGTAGTMVVTWE